MNKHCVICGDACDYALCKYHSKLSLEYNTQELHEIQAEEKERDAMLQRTRLTTSERNELFPILKRNLEPLVKQHFNASIRISAYRYHDNTKHVSLIYNIYDGYTEHTEHIEMMLRAAGFVSAPGAQF